MQKIGDDARVAGFAYYLLVESYSIQHKRCKSVTITVIMIVVRLFPIEISNKLFIQWMRAPRVDAALAPGANIFSFRFIHHDGDPFPNWQRRTLGRQLPLRVHLSYEARGIGCGT